ncbi:hypothetical protein G4G28_22040 [Massilia sp. Dwa41.01b]|uniref:hypothetical protein n=1 Tax=unclassified Massilia TaxID=2609279 RepID=UPI0016001868|nr:MULTISPECIES: hypothetical protein [unclassified Massilia]QNA90511.1 hypothetical protein G4G28_22040 [Massilia sp. Dwa41.01b]QNA97742.1 hypothetical protein G4G31_01125 [Massilia sp. Se16.2.3]
MTTISLALGTLAMAFVVGSKAYVQAAGAEARGVHALAAIVAGTVAPAPVTLNPGLNMALNREANG